MKWILGPGGEYRLLLAYNNGAVRIFRKRKTN
jgi:hypothetical protein